MQQQQATFRPRMKRLAEGLYLVESSSRKGMGHKCNIITGTCGCTAGRYNRPCRHLALARQFDAGIQMMRAQATAPRKEGEWAVAVPMSAGAPSGIVRPVRGEGEAYMASTGARGMDALAEIFG